MVSLTEMFGEIVRVLDFQDTIRRTKQASRAGSQDLISLANSRTSVSGVGARLLIVIFGIGAVSALVAGAAIYAFFDVGHSLALIDRRVDPILASVEVSRSVERIVTAASALSAATTEQRRDHLFDKLSRQSAKLRSFLTELRDGGISQEQLAPIEGNAVQLDANLTALDADVRLRLQLIGRIKDLMQAVFDTNDETQRLLGPTLLVYDSQLDHLAKLLTGAGQPPDGRRRSASAGRRSIGRSAGAKGAAAGLRRCGHLGAGCG